MRIIWAYVIGNPPGKDRPTYLNDLKKERIFDPGFYKNREITLVPIIDRSTQIVISWFAGEESRDSTTFSRLSKYLSNTTNPALCIDLPRRVEMQKTLDSKRFVLVDTGERDYAEVIKEIRSAAHKATI